MHENNSYNTISFSEISGVVISGTCVGTYDPSNYIVSPNFPQEYGNDIDCRWLISSPDAKNIRLKFLYFKIEDFRDILKVYEGQNIHGNLIDTYAGNSPSTIVSSGNSMYLRFTSDHSATYQGFKIEVSGK